MKDSEEYRELLAKENEDMKEQYERQIADMKRQAAETEKRMEAQIQQRVRTELQEEINKRIRQDVENEQGRWAEVLAEKDRELARKAQETEGLKWEVEKSKAVHLKDLESVKIAYAK